MCFYAHVGDMSNVYICGAINANYRSVLRGVKRMTSFDINATLYPIIAGVVALMPSFLDLILAVVPIVIVMSVVGFIIKFWDQIVAMMKF